MKNKSVLLLVVIGMLLMVFPTAALAEEAPELRYVISGSSGISVYGKTISVDGITRSGFLEDEIAVYTNLQQKVGSSWVTFYSCFNSNSNSKTVTVSGSYTVGSGTYRVYSIHKTTKDGITDTTYSYSHEVSV